MNFNEYVVCVRADAEEYIDDNYNPDQSFDDFFYDMELSVTGNDNGSYYCSSHLAREAVSEVIFDPEFIDEAKWYGADIFYNRVSESDIFELLLDPEGLDVIVRIVVLSSLFNELKRYYENKVDGNEEEDDID